jgi:hypothetical protein
MDVCILCVFGVARKQHETRAAMQKRNRLCNSRISESVCLYFLLEECSSPVA